MKAKVKQLWLQALRSGEYKQTKGALKRPDGFCCLGVLTDICIKAGEAKHDWSDGTISSSYGSPFCHDVDLLPLDIQVWAGINSNDFTLMAPSAGNPQPHPYSLSRFNDEGATFAEIADLIEAQVKGEE